MFIRKNVYELGGDWADTILWYARGVKAMKARALANSNSWRFFGGIHGIDQQLWTQFGYLSPAEPMPSSADLARYWSQCQHGSWYFLPWHRGYLIAIEANIRAEVIALGGPHDWSLPYWNYFKPNQFKLPPAFASANWPDGNGDNPLFVTQRHGPNNDGNVFVLVNQINLKALTDPAYTGVANGGSRGFGGIDTGFSHNGNFHGRVEQMPHDVVHGMVGGGEPQDPNIPGLMSDPDTAGLDPIFYLHHCNIDRLWQSWRENPASHHDPTAAKWLNGPASVGQRKFSMPLPQNKPFDYTPDQMRDLTKLGYKYDDLSSGVQTKPPAGRMTTLGMPPQAASALGEAAIVSSGDNVELVGANRGSLSIQGTEVGTTVEMDAGARKRVVSSLSAVAESATPSAPDRVFLNLENVRGLADSTTFSVYVGLPDGPSPVGNPDQLAGTIALFGVRKASAADGEHAGEGLNYSFEITDIVDAMHLSSSFDVDTLNVRIVPVNPVAPEAQITVGRVSIFRQGA